VIHLRLSNSKYCTFALQIAENHCIGYTHSHTLGHTHTHTGCFEPIRIRTRIRYSMRYVR